MIQGRFYGSFFVALLMAAAQAAGQAPEGNELKVDVSGVKDKKGELVICLFTKKAGFPDDLTKADKTVTVKAESAIHTFKDLPVGKYVVVVFHDLDGNGKLTKNRLGFPSEPIGLSNHKKPGPDGPPDFEKAKVDTSKVSNVKMALFTIGK